MNLMEFRQVPSVLITTGGASLVRLGRTLREWFSLGGHRVAERRQTGPILTGLRLRWHYRLLYLGTLKQELCNVYHRMEILRNRHLCQTGTTLLSVYEQGRLSPHLRRTLTCARIRGIQRLQTILPTATLVDLHLAVELFQPHLFVEEESMEVQSPPSSGDNEVSGRGNRTRENRPSGPLRLSARSLGGGQLFFSHRFAAAFAAIAERFLGVKAAARAAPPFRPPSRPRATAAGFLGFTTGGDVFSASPMDSRKTRCASSLGSRGRVFERSGMFSSKYGRDILRVKGSEFQTDPLPCYWRELP